MRLFANKKKEDKESSSSTQGHNNHNAIKQRPPPSPNGLYGNGYTSDLPSSSFAGQGVNGTRSPMSPMSPMSPIFAHNNHHDHGSNGSYGHPPPPTPQSPVSLSMAMNGGPPSPLQQTHPQSAALLATPQLFWTQRRILGTNPFPRFQHTSSIIANGSDIFLFGGSQRGTTKGDLFVIDSVSLQCLAVAATGADPPIAKSGHSAVNIGQYIIYFGGWDSTTGQCDDSLHVLHTARKEWNKPPIQGPLPTPRHSHTGCSVGTVMYIFGGQVENFYLSDVVAFDMKTITQNPKWERLEPQTESPPARSGHCAGVFEGKIYIFGGADADYFYNDIWCFDPRALTWTPIPASGYLPTGRHGHSCTVVDGTMYIFGGNSPDSTELNDAFAFKIHERRWYLFQNVGPVASPRSGHTMCTIKDRIFVLGGESEQTKLEDSALIYYLETTKIRFPDSGPHVFPPRQTSTQKLIPNRPGEGSPTPYQQAPMDTPPLGGRDPERNSDPLRSPQRPERPDRPDRRHTQRPSSPATFGPPDRQGSIPSLSVSQQTSQLMNPQLGQRPMTSYGTPPPRGASAGFQNSMNDYQSEGLSIATRRQTMKDDFHGEYGGAVIGTAQAVNALGMHRKSMHQTPLAPTSGTTSPSPLRVINVTPNSPPLSAKPLSNGDGDAGSPTSRRPSDRGHMDSTSPTALGRGNYQVEEPINPYVMEAITLVTPTTPTTPTTSIGGSYVPPPPTSTAAIFPAPKSAPPPLPLSPPATTVETAMDAIEASSPQSPPPPPPPENMLGNLPPPPTGTPSPPASASIPFPSNAGKKSSQVAPPVPPSTPPPASFHSLGASTPIPGPLDRSSTSSPAPGRFAARGPGSPNEVDLGTSGSATTAATDHNMRSPATDLAKIKAAQDENMQLRKELKEREEEIEKMRKRENWLVTEVILSREKDNTVSLQENSKQSKRMSMAELERELYNEQLHGQQLTITKALVHVKEELKTAKMAIATQARMASTKIKEAERIRTGALQEAAYLKAKLSSLPNAHNDPSSLARIETERASDLEKRLTQALNELDSIENQYRESQNALEQERRSRALAEERVQGATSLAEQAQAAHTRALSELAALHARAKKAEAESREVTAQLVKTQAGFSGHQSQSSGLLSRIAGLKEQIEEHEKALERTQMAYTAANERAERAEARADEASQRIETLEGLRLGLSNELNRTKGESERLQSKVEELENRWQVSKEEVITLRKLVEDGLGAFNPRGNHLGNGDQSMAQTSERKHDSIAILNTVSRVSELEHELGSLKKLHSVSQKSATKSAEELAEAMIEVSQLEQISMQARAETISLQKTLSQEREASAQLKNELVKAEQELESKIKELEDHEVQLGLLKDVMREKGIIAEDMMIHARARGTVEYAASMEEKVRKAEECVQKLKQELIENRGRHQQQLEAFENQRQSTIQHSEKTAFLLRKLKNDLEATMKEKDAVETELRQIQDDHAQCQEKLKQQLSQLRNSHKDQEEERVQMLQMHWDQERSELTAQLHNHQSRLMESDMHAAELSQKVISLTERLEEVESVNEAVTEELEAMQAHVQEVKTKAATEEAQLQADVERLVTEIHQVQEKLVERQQELDDAFELNQELENQLEKSLQAQAEAATSISANTDGQLKPELKQRMELEDRLKKAQETIQILRGDNSVLEARLADSEKKVTLLLEDMQHQSRHNSINMYSAQQTNGGRNGSSDSTNTSNHSNPAAASAIIQAQGRQADNTSFDNDAYGQQYNQNYGHHSPSSISRDSVDSITRELELLKVPWNKTVAPMTSFKSANASPPMSKLTSASSPAPATLPASGHYSPQQQRQQTNKFYDYGNAEDDSSEDDNEEEYLAHFRQQQQQQHQHITDTHSFNDRNSSRLKEYEQMIDEIENARMH
ncbi:Negative regulator of mitotic exit [Haplosporangium sp. Z 767]|nr:Negative regulator of mitotic exit [Haplosporangium sp. Z 767]KAF9195797.1 Negative regulator of mitotic exit [Haplosporangium sp. Z 11]